MSNKSMSLKSWAGLGRVGGALVGMVAASCATAYGGGIVVDNDEWTLSDAGFVQEGAANGAAYALNAAKFLTGGSGSILIYSDDFGVAGADLHNVLTGAGYSVTEDPTLSTPFTAVGLSGFKAVFLAGNVLSSAQISALSAYETAGGGVYIAGGTGAIPGGAAAEAAQWNPFLHPYGLSLASTFNGINATIPVVSSSPVLAGVSQLYYDNGNTVSATGPGRVITTDGVGGAGLIATYPASVPDGTSTLVLATLSLGLLGLGAKFWGLNPKVEAR